MNEYDDRYCGLKACIGLYIYGALVGLFLLAVGFWPGAIAMLVALIGMIVDDLI